MFLLFCLLLTWMGLSIHIEHNSPPSSRWCTYCIIIQGFIGKYDTVVLNNSKWIYWICAVHLGLWCEYILCLKRRRSRLPGIFFLVEWLNCPGFVMTHNSDIVCFRVNSSVHAVIVSSMCVYAYLYDDELQTNPIWYWFFNRF